MTSEQVLEAQMKADMADKEMLESSQSKYEEEVREKCSVISEQKAVRSLQEKVLLKVLELLEVLEIRYLCICSSDHQRHGLQDEQPGAEDRRAVRGQQAGGQQQHLHAEEHVSLHGELSRRVAPAGTKEPCLLQESPGGDDLGAATTEVLPGVAGREAGGSERQAGGAPGEDEPAGAEQQEPSAGAGDSAARGETKN